MRKLTLLIMTTATLAATASTARCSTSSPTATAATATHAGNTASWNTWNTSNAEKLTSYNCQQESFAAFTQNGSPSFMNYKPGTGGLGINASMPAPGHHGDRQRGVVAQLDALRLLQGRQRPARVRLQGRHRRGLVREDQRRRQRCVELLVGELGQGLDAPRPGHGRRRAAPHGLQELDRPVALHARQERQPRHRRPDDRDVGDRLVGDHPVHAGRHRPLPRLQRPHGQAWIERMDSNGAGSSTLWGSTWSQGWT